MYFCCISNLQSQQRFEYEYGKMGTQIRLVFYASNRIEADSLSKKVCSRIDRLNQILSDYISESELNLLSKSACMPINVSSELFKLVRKSDSISRITKGAFDITSGPLVQLWRETRKNNKLPLKEDIESALKRVGYESITFPRKNAVVLSKKEMKLDVGAIGKGYVADEMINFLKSEGISSALIDMGGDICVSDPPPGRSYWILAFSFYNNIGEKEVKKVQLKNGAVATSGDLYQFIEIEGKRYSHIINPITGIALTNNVQVTVIAKSGTHADAFASAFSVWGISKTKENIDDLKGISAYMIENSTENGFNQWASPNFNNLME